MSDNRESVKQHLLKLVRAGVGSVVLASTSLSGPAAEAAPSKTLDRPAIDERVNQARSIWKDEIGLDRPQQSDSDAMQLAWYNWRNGGGSWSNYHPGWGNGGWHNGWGNGGPDWHNFHNWHNWHN